MNFAAAKTDQDFLQNASIDTLKQITGEYPYFSPAQFFLTKKLKKENDSSFLPQLQKSAVYFFNPFWLHYQLLHEINFTEQAKTTVAEVSMPDQKAEEQNHNNAELNETATVDPDEKILNPEDENILKEDIHKVLADDFNENEEEKQVEVHSKLSGVLQAQLEEFKKPVEQHAEIPVEIRSYHTIDYFASQGIKLDLQAQDKLGKQVLRFTDWLKQMKRINPQPSDLGTEKELENKVIDNAAHSNEPKEVLTEAMAEVLEKQGKTNQAVELYEKLSLLHPGKSIYFAARIQNLKGQ